VTAGRRRAPRSARACLLTWIGRRGTARGWRRSNGTVCAPCSPMPPEAREAHRRSARSLARAVGVVVVPPLVGRRLRVALRRVLPFLLAPERGDVEVTPGAAQLLVATVVDEVGAEDAIAVADEGVGPVPLVDPEVSVEWFAIPCDPSDPGARPGGRARQTPASCPARSGGRGARLGRRRRSSRRRPAPDTRRRPAGRW